MPDPRCAPPLQLARSGSSQPVRAGSRVRRPEGVLEFSSEIPDAYPGKGRVEQWARGVFDRLPGRWTVAIRRAAHGFVCWGFVEVRGPADTTRTFIVDRFEDIGPRLTEEFAPEGAE